VRWHLIEATKTRKPRGPSCPEAVVFFVTAWLEGRNE
jgi:hypothetical protein